MAEVRTEKTIRLTALKPEDYRLWAAQSEATFHVHGVLDIVLGRETILSPVVTSTPSDDAGNDAASYQKLQKQDALARQALLACLASEELTKVYQLKSSHEIWQRLADEYGVVSDLKRAQASAAFYSLQKKTSMQDHINEFTRLQQEVNYHRGSGSPLTNIDINLAFLQSLGDSWKTFQQSIGPRLHTISPPQLFAEVLAFDFKNHPNTTSNVSDPLALASFQQHRHPKSQHNSRPYDRPNSNVCFYCKRKGHIIKDCFKKKWRDTQAMGEEVQATSGGEKISPDWEPQSKPCWNYTA